MRKSWLYSGLLSVPLLMATGGIATAQDHGHDTAAETASADITRTMNWSDRSAWPSGKVPVAGDEVTIPRGTEVVLDVSTPVLRSLTVQGKLTFADTRDLELSTDWIYLPGGHLQVGTEAKPHTH